MFWEMMRGIYKKLFAEFFPRYLPMEDFAVPSRRLAEKGQLFAISGFKSLIFTKGSPVC